MYFHIQCMRRIVNEFLKRSPTFSKQRNSFMGEAPMDKPLTKKLKTFFNQIGIF